jgi:hypothetical protein
VLQLRDGVGEFGGARHGQRGARAADGVDEVVVAQGGAGAKGDGARRGVDVLSRVDDQSDVVGEDLAVVHDRVVGAGDELMQPDPLDEPGPWVDQGDGDVVVEPEMVGGDDTGVSATDDDDVGLLGHENSSEMFRLPVEPA